MSDGVGRGSGDGGGGGAGRVLLQERIIARELQIPFFGSIRRGRRIYILQIKSLVWF